MTKATSMSEDLTKRFEGGSPFERRVIAEFASMRGDIAKIRVDVDVLRTEISEIRVQQTAMARNIASLDQRLTSLEEKVDMRLKETQPIWEAVKAKIDKLDQKFTLFIRDLYEIRGDIVGHSKRLDTLEGKVLS
jgi:chromosome segregation ATPase